MKISSNYKNYFLSVIASLIFYFILPNFGINDTFSKNIFLLLASIYIFFIFLNKFIYLFYFLNFLVFVYLVQKNIYEFSIAFFQAFFIATFPIFPSLNENNKFTTFFEEGKKYSFTYAFLIFGLTLLSQNSYLDFEIIDHDISTSLVIANDIFKGYLPYERVWDDKQPLFYFFNYVILFFSGKNFIYYKIIFDIFIFVNALLIFKIISKRFRMKKTTGLISSVTYLAFMSLPWANAEYSETMSLSFLGLAYYGLLGGSSKKTANLTWGIFIGISTLINIGSSIFLIGFFVLVILQNKKHIIQKGIYLFFGFTFVHSTVILIYFSQSLLDIYLLTLFKIPLSYTGTDTYFFYDLRAFLESIYKTSNLLSLLFLILLFSSWTIFSKIISTKIYNIYSFSNLTFIFISICFFYLAGKGFYHHLIYLMFFISISFGFLEGSNIRYIFFVISFLLYQSYLLPISSNSISNLVNAQTIYNNYPVKTLSESIKKNFSDDFTVLALDKVIILFYLDKLNEAYIIHPTNHNEPFIIDNLTEYGFIDENILNTTLSKNPNLIICSVNEEGDLYYKIDSITDFKCNENQKFTSTIFQLDQDVFRKSEFYYNPNVDVKILINK